MKHIIDIDEDMYKQVIANDTVYVLDDIDLIMLENAIAEGKPLREELEELEAKIKPFTKDRINPHCYDVGFINGALECLWVLQKRIKELNND